MSLFRTHSAAVYGVDAVPIEIEVDAQPSGQSPFTIVGLPDAAVRESRERIKSALAQAGFALPNRAVTVNLAPANLRKEGPGFDLPIALGMIGAIGALTGDTTSNLLTVGELALDGRVRPIRGALPIAACAAKRGARGVVVPAENAPEAALVEGVKVFGVRTLADAVAVARNPGAAASFSPSRNSVTAPTDCPDGEYDFADVKGQEAAKRALEIAAAGGHNVLLVGPPGSGKSMLAKRIPSILPPLTSAEALETTKIHSVKGILDDTARLFRQRPFRAPHHSITSVGLVGGGGGVPRPGEVSLAHNGVLFLDELPEFPRHVLDLLRQPLEDGSVAIVRNAMSVEFPARFVLVAAMNSCPCGYFGDSFRECRCTPAMIQRYLGRVSGPLLDRIDLHVEVPTVQFNDLRDQSGSERSSSIRARIETARAIQIRRGCLNANLGTKAIRLQCALNDRAEGVLKAAVARLGLSARAHDRVLRVARTIADLDGCDDVSATHVAEAVQYRTLDRTYWA